MAENPYRSMPDRQFWRRGVDGWSEGTYKDLYKPRFPITRKTRISTAGSCFAQNIGRELRARRYNYQDFEPSPVPRLDLKTYGYGLFSGRYGNIYTSRQFLQMCRRAVGRFKPSQDVWEKDGRFYDPFRPSIEPNGFGSAEELRAVRDSHFRAVRRMVKKSDVMVFTLGLTEMWMDKVDGAAYPTCPGTVAGEFDPERHVFKNLSFGEILEDMEATMAWMRKHNPNLRFLLTVSPVPLAATAEDQHVAVSTTYSKSVLRAVAGELRARHDFVDYFPSYEIITSPMSRGAHYESGMREVSMDGVANVMRCFFEAHGDFDGPPAPNLEMAGSAEYETAEAKEMEVICDEAKLDPVVA
ncbi:MAG: GSCFA family protein [Brevundimonas sp.]|nr:MAG: GSCFA family protein [Brevundimonas sp.]